jgi:ABC-type molybdenum transport system ATPase subunit/photorepair protein PhrA
VVPLQGPAYSAVDGPPPESVLSEASRRGRKNASKGSLGDLSESNIARTLLPQKVTAISQQSRFHKDTLETLSNDVDLKGVCITVDDHELLVDAELSLFSGVKYGLVGRNGIGKSSRLFCVSAHAHQANQRRAP